MRCRASSFWVPALVLALAGTAWGRVIPIPVSEHRAGIERIGRTDDRMTFRVTVGELAAFDVVTREGTFTRLLLPGFHSSDDVGKPALPMINRLFEIPYGAAVSAEVVSFETREITLAGAGVRHPLMPAQPSVFKNQDFETLPFHCDWTTYHTDREYGRDPVRAVDTGRLRGVRIGRLEVAPVRYNPVAGTLTVLENIEIEVRFAGADYESEFDLKASTYSPFFEVLYRRIEGYRGLHDSYPDHLDGPVTYVIVSDPMFEAQLQPFVEWKVEQGFNVIEAYTDDPQVGSTTTSIQAYLHDLYNNGTPSNPAPTFVLFVGDTDEIPAFTLSGYSDLPYCDVTGDDVPDMYYGRFSASSTADLQPQIDKTLEYEMYQMPDPSYLGEVVLIAGVDSYYASTHGNGQINYGTNHYFNAAHGILSHTYLYPASGSSDAQIIQDVSEGCAYVNYTAHGSQTSWSDPTFTMSNVSNLGNNHEYCLAVGNCCLTASMQVTTCFAEHWLRVADRGAIGYIGGANNTLWDEDYYWGVGYGPVVGSGATYEETGMGAYDGMFHDHGEGIGQWYVCQDAHVFCGNLGVQESGSGYTDYYWEIYNLMGEPSLMVYFGVPDSNNVVLPMNILPTDTEVVVSAEPKSYVGFSKDGVLLGGGLIGESGTAVIPIAGQGSTGVVGVVVTCQNKIPYAVDVPVMSVAGPYLVHDHNVVMDGGGDGDGEVDAGETVELVTYLRNLGSDPATNTVGVLAETRALVITDDTETWGTITPAEIKPCDDSFDFSVTAGTPDQTEIEFTLTVTCDETTFVHGFDVTVEAPVVDWISCLVDDAAGGDGDGMAEPGETMDLILRVGNTGHDDARNVTGVVWSSSDLLTINDDTGAVASVPENGEADVVGFNVTVDPLCPEMSTIQLHFDLTGDFGYSRSLEVPLPIAPFVEDFEGTLTWTINSTASTGAWEQADPEGTTYNGEPCQPEDDHTPAPGVQCMVTGPLAGAAASAYDVDGGITVLTSARFDLSEQISATVEYWRWYTNDFGSNPGEDWWTVEVSDDDGDTWEYLEHTQESANSWQKMSFRLEDFIDLTTQVRFRFTAADEGGGSLVEAAMDDFMLYGLREDLTAVEEDARVGAHAGFALKQNRPNPFNPETEIVFSLDSVDPICTRLDVYDTRGRRVRTLVEQDLGAGEHRVYWDGKDSGGHPVSSGVYFYRLSSGEREQTRKMILLK